MRSRLVALLVLLGVPPLVAWLTLASAPTSAATASVPRLRTVMATIPAPAPGLLPIRLPRASRASATPLVTPARSGLARRERALPVAVNLTPHPPRAWARGSRDPFVSLLAGSFEGEENTPVFDVGELHLVGVLWGESDRFAVVENGHGRGTALRAGDRLVNGYVDTISPTSVTLVETSRRGPRRIVLHMKESPHDERTE